MVLKFSDSFWGEEDNGLEVILARMREGRKTVSGLHDFLTTRITIEEDYGRKILKLSKSVFAKDELQSVNVALSGLNENMERVGNSHLQFAANLRSHIETGVTQLSSELRTVKHNQKVAVMKQLKAKYAQIAVVQKSKEKYFAKCAEKNSILNSKPSSGMPKDIEKHELKVKKAKEMEMAADEEYSNNVAKLKSIHSSWKQQMILSCEEFQRLEERRLQVIQSAFLQFAEFETAHIRERNEATQAIERLIRGIDVNSDIQEFISTKSTGSDIPDNIATIPYINYYTEAPMESIKSPAIIEPDITISSSTTFDRESKSQLNMEQLNISKSTHSSILSPTVLYKVKTLYVYDAQADEELSFEANEIISVTNIDEDPWWFGHLTNGKSGLFPSNFVEKLE